MDEWYISREGDSQGPYRREEVARMLQQGQLLPQDFVWAPGLEDWSRAAQHFGAPTSAPPVPHEPFPQRVQPRTTDSNAIASLVLGLVGLCAFQLLGPAAIWFGMRARREIAASGGTQDGEGMATVGMVTGILATVMLAFAFLFYLIFLILISTPGVLPEP